MSFYRTLFVAVAALALASPVVADDASTTTTTTTQNASDNANAQTTTTTDSSMQKINVNTASVQDLSKIKGLNASKARAIISYRKKHGDFKSLDELANVKGFKKIKPDMMQKIQDQLSVD
ncbi:MAG TPA: helix-hairpin-helix domain-containing protein [Gammaproteobacteria bacterium]|jgi:competence protein ComEA|nr:helix-hairpin-helix domain-containing protein [Gammaproteobacteria bacterium]